MRAICPTLRINYELQLLRAPSSQISLVYAPTCTNPLVATEDISFVPVDNFRNRVRVDTFPEASINYTAFAVFLPHHAAEYF